MKTTIEKVKQQIADVIKQRDSDLATIREQIGKERETEQAAIRDMEKATSALDPFAYAEAAKKRDNANLAIQMYASRETQLYRKRYVTEEESDAVIDSLLDYETELRDNYEGELSKHLKELAKLTDEYRAAVRDTEETIRSWTANVHPNHRSPGTIYSATGTSRSPSPVPVHRVAFFGCPSSDTIRELLSKLSNLLRD